MKVDFSKVIELSHDMIPSAPTADVKPFDHSPEAAPFWELPASLLSRCVCRMRMVWIR